MAAEAFRKSMNMAKVLGNVGVNRACVKGLSVHKIQPIYSSNFSQNRRLHKPSVRSRCGIVVTQNRSASEIGARVLKAGGHAVDAAVASAFALGVVEPWMSGVGGVGGMLVHDSKRGKTTAIDFGARSPLGLNTSDFILADTNDKGGDFGWPMIVGNINAVGAKAVVAPTQPAGLEMAHRQFGKLRWRDLIAPAIRLADNGIVVDWHTTLHIAGAMGDLVHDPSARALFLPHGVPPVTPAAVDRIAMRHLQMPDLARTLRAIAENGNALYKGPIARAIVDDVQAMGGYLSIEDLAAVRPREVEPLEIIYGNQTIHVLPELNGGPTLSVAFGELVKRRDERLERPTAETFCAYAEALHNAWKDRFNRLGDSGERTSPTSTTHISVVDRDGNMVALTLTLLSLFGARIVLPSTGILMNNGLNWFDPIPGGPNSIKPDRAALANYVPAIMKGNIGSTAIGGSGGRRIIAAVFQILAMSVDFKIDLEQIFHEPRIDVSGVDVVVADRRFPQATLDKLAAKFPLVVAESIENPFHFTVASAVRRVGDMNEGATEPQHPWSDAVSEDDV